MPHARMPISSFAGAATKAPEGGESGFSLGRAPKIEFWQFLGARVKMPQWGGKPLS